MNELTFKLYSPLTAELVCHDPEDWCADEVLAFDGRAIVENEAEILAQIEQEGDHLEQYLDTESDSYLAAHVKSIVVSVEKRNGSLCGCATVVVDEDLTKRGWKELKDYLSGQYSDGWGEGFEQRDIQIAEGILNVHFWQPENFAITVVLAETRSQAERSAANVAATGNGNRTLQPPQPDKKYEITDIAHPVYPELHRIRALRQVREDVPAGELGGFVQSEANLSQGSDDAWLYDDSISRHEASVCGGAQLHGRTVAQDLALVSGSSTMYGNAIACDSAIVTGGCIRNDALVCGNARVRENPATHIAPVVTGQSVVMGDLSGSVVVFDRGFILPGQTVDNPTRHMIGINERGAAIVHDCTLAPGRGSKNRNNPER